MSQLRAKQIKLTAVGDLLVGGANGTGTVLAKGADGQVLKVVEGGLSYVNNTAADISFTPAGSIAASTVQAAIAEVASDAADALAAEVTNRSNAVQAVQDELDATQAGAGLGTDGAYVADATTTYLKTATSLKGADKLLDAAIKSVADSVAGLNNAALATEIDAIEAAVGLTTDGAFVPYASGSAGLQSATTVASAVAAVDAYVTSAVSGEASTRFDADNALGDRIDNLDTALGIAGETYAANESANYIQNATSFADADNKLDAALKAEADARVAADANLQTQINNLSGLNALHFKGTIAGTATAADLTALAAVSGDVYRIITAGASDFAETGIEVNVGDFVAFAGSAWVKFDNTDPTFTAGDKIAVTGNAHDGYTIALSGKADVTSANTAITVTGGVGAALEAVSIAFNAGNVSLNSLAGTLSVAKGGTGLTAAGSEGQVLTSGAEGLEYAFVSAVKTAAGATVADASSGKLLAASATVAGDNALAYTTKGFVDAAVANAVAGAEKTVVVEDFTATAAQVAFELASAPIGNFSVYFNGLKIAKAAYVYADGSVTLNTATIGYGVDAGDVISVEYTALAV